METDTTYQATEAPRQPEAEPVEPRGERLRRHSHRTGLYAWALGSTTAAPS